MLTLGRLPPQPQPTDQGTAPAEDQQGPPASQPADQPVDQSAPSTSGTGGTSASGATGGTPQDQPSQQHRRSWPEMQLARKC